MVTRGLICGGWFFTCLTLSMRTSTEAHHRATCPLHSTPPIHHLSHAPVSTASQLRRQGSKTPRSQSTSSSTTPPTRLPSKVPPRLVPSSVQHAVVLAHPPCLARARPLHTHPVSPREATLIPRFVGSFHKACHIDARGSMVECIALTWHALWSSPAQSCPQRAASSTPTCQPPSSRSPLVLLSTPAARSGLKG